MAVYDAAAAGAPQAALHVLRFGKCVPQAVLIVWQAMRGGLTGAGCQAEGRCCQEERKGAEIKGDWLQEAQGQHQACTLCKGQSIADLLVTLPATAMPTCTCNLCKQKLEQVIIKLSCAAGHCSST